MAAASSMRDFLPWATSGLLENRNPLLTGKKQGNRGIMAQAPEEISPRRPYIPDMENNHVIFALKRKRAELAGLLPEAERRLESLRQTLTRVNAT